ncbi:MULTISPECIES: hypothetical protein [Flavobacteriaceae]|uniref:Secreted protein n=3 Tax=Flavobacteriaceae TaxID=49546 RepID=A0A1L7IAF5_9FLAO|nr:MULTISPECIES: hypothetical protein [Flavobacteriaceae]APU70102.1 secreted protein [Christiangramia flava JLT2011]MCP9200521.1 hypothetical protein [Gramella oceanisediminis]MDT0642635.1 hypothetical protein [Zunongwangia sp. F363]OSS39589.1 secreted protein [Christiangramia flava JLT2011]
MNFRNLFFAAILVFGFSACRDTAKEDHGHEHEEGTETHEEDAHGHPHNEDGSHMEGDHMEQEEFKVGEDSLEMHEESDHHTHDDGTEHEDH